MGRLLDPQCEKIEEKPSCLHGGRELVDNASARHLAGPAASRVEAFLPAQIVRPAFPYRFRRPVMLPNCLPLRRLRRSLASDVNKLAATVG